MKFAQNNVNGEICCEGKKLKRVKITNKKEKEWLQVCNPKIQTEESHVQSTVQ